MKIIEYFILCVLCSDKYYCPKEHIAMFFMYQLACLTIYTLVGTLRCFIIVHSYTVIVLKMQTIEEHVF